jgi:hypothetical protein
LAGESNHGTPKRPATPKESQQLTRIRNGATGLPGLACFEGLLDL